MVRYFAQGMLRMRNSLCAVCTSRKFCPSHVQWSSVPSNGSVCPWSPFTSAPERDSCLYCQVKRTHARQTAAGKYAWSILALGFLTQMVHMSAGLDQWRLFFVGILWVISRRVYPRLLFLIVECVLLAKFLTNLIFLFVQSEMFSAF